MGSNSSPGGRGAVTVGLSAGDTALFAVLSSLTIYDTGQVTLGGANATVRASTIVNSGGVIAGAGTLAGLGGGNGTVQLASIENDGVIDANVSGGNLLLYGNVTGSGVLSVDSGATLTLQAGVGSGQMLEFGSNSLVVLNDAGAFSGTMIGLDDGDRIDIGGTEVIGASWSSVSGGMLTLDTPGPDIKIKVAGSCIDQLCRAVGRPWRHRRHSGDRRRRGDVAPIPTTPRPPVKSTPCTKSWPTAARR